MGKVARIILTYHKCEVTTKRLSYVIVLTRCRRLGNIRDAKRIMFWPTVCCLVTYIQTHFVRGYRIVTLYVYFVCPHNSPLYTIDSTSFTDMTSRLQSIMSNSNSYFSKPEIARMISKHDINSIFNNNTELNHDLPDHQRYALGLIFRKFRKISTKTLIFRTSR